MTTFQEWDAKLRADVHQIQRLAELLPTEIEQVDRIQYIAMAAAHCLAWRMGPAAAGYWLHEIAKCIEAQGHGDVH